MEVCPSDTAHWLLCRQQTAVKTGRHLGSSWLSSGERMVAWSTEVEAEIEAEIKIFSEADLTVPGDGLDLGNNR